MTKAGMGRAKAGAARRSTAAAAYGEETEGEEDGLAGSDGSSGETVEAECDGGLTLPEEKHGDMCAPCARAEGSVLLAPFRFARRAGTLAWSYPPKLSPKLPAGGSGGP